MAETVPSSIFLEFSLPNSTTWFYFSVILAIALFFKFNRLFSVRNWDLVTLFAMVPGLLLVQEGHERRREARALAATAIRLHALPDPGGAAALIAGAIDGPSRNRDAIAGRRLWWGYVVLIAGSAYWMLRCVLDLTLIRRPALAPNLNPAGLAWFAATLFVSLGAIAVTKPATDELPLGPPNIVIQEAVVQTTKVVSTAVTADPRWWVERSLSGSCHLMVVIALILIGARHFGDTSAGMAAATAYLLLPYIAFHLTHVHHVLPTAFLLWAVLGYRRPRVAGTFVGIAAGGFIFPFLVVPVWAGLYKGRGLARFLTAFAIAAGVSLVLAGLVLWINDQFNLRIPTTIGLPELKKWRVPDAEGFWTGVHWAYRIPVFIAALSFVFLTAFWPSPKDLGNVLALSSAHLIGAQLWYAQRGGAYVLWYLPLVLLMIFRPNLTDRRPPERTTSASTEPATQPIRPVGSWALLRVFRAPP